MSHIFDFSRQSGSYSLNYSSSSQNTIGFNFTSSGQGFYSVADYHSNYSLSSGSILEISCTAM